MNWKYIDNTHTSVYRITTKGEMESCDVTSIAEWIALGNAPTIEDVVVSPQITEVKSVQAFHALALTSSGTTTLYNEVLIWINTQPLSIQIDFNKRETFTIGHPAIQAFKRVKGWTDVQLQNLFTFASTL